MQLKAAEQLETDTLVEWTNKKEHQKETMKKYTIFSIHPLPWSTTCHTQQLHKVLCRLTDLYMTEIEWTGSQPRFTDIHFYSPMHLLCGHGLLLLTLLTFIFTHSMAAQTAM